MTSGTELRRLKSEISSFDCRNIEDLKFFSGKIALHIRKIYESDIPQDELMNEYVESVILKHLDIIEDFIQNLDAYKEREVFVSKSLRYHFNCIIDSYTHATIAYQR